MLRTAFLTNLADPNHPLCCRLALDDFFYRHRRSILLTIGLMALGIFLFRHRATDRTLLYFGIFVVLYAVRDDSRQARDSFRFRDSSGRRSSHRSHDHFTIGLPALFSSSKIVQARWSTVFQWVLAAQVAFTVLALISEALR